MGIYDDVMHKSKGQHGTLRLLQTICTLEEYPQFSKFAPKLKRELEERFKDIKPNSNGKKRTGRIIYYPNGLIKYEPYRYERCYEGSVSCSAIIKPFKFTLPESKPGYKKTSHTRKVYKNKYSHLPNIYKYILLDDVGLKLYLNKNSCDYFGEKRVLKVKEMAKQVLKQKLAVETKIDLLNSVLRKAFDNVYWMEGSNHLYRYQDKEPKEEEIDECLIIAFASRIFGSSIKITKKRDGAGYSYDNLHRKIESDVIETLPKRYFAEFIMPEKRFLGDLKNGIFKFGDYSDWEEKDKENAKYVALYNSYSRVPFHFDTIEELVEQFKETMLSMKNKRITKIIKKIGFVVKNE